MDQIRRRHSRFNRTFLLPDNQPGEIVTPHGVESAEYRSQLNVGHTETVSDLALACARAEAHRQHAERDRPASVHRIGAAIFSPPMNF
jgi:hypothetical protein